MDKKNEDKRSQKDKFLETAKELNCEQNEKAFDEKLKKITPRTSKKEESK